MTRMTKPMHARPKSQPEPVSLPDRAIENLRYIRNAMEGASAFTAISGWGLALAGFSALGAAWIASTRTGTPWLVVWLIEAALGLGLSFAFTLRKARRAGAPILRGAGRRFVLGFAPPSFAAVLLTPPLLAAGAHEVLAGTWLLLYGAAITTAGAFSVRAVPAMGAAFMVTGALALAFPPLRDVWLALGFGGLHIVFGAILARRHGG